jgi:predicted nucleic acid-binding protein
MRTLVLDASVALAWYLNEPWSSSARQWRGELMRGMVAFIVPPLHFCEVANALRKRVRSGELEYADACDVYTLHCEAPLRTVSPNYPALLTTAHEYEATAYDAAYIRLALDHDAPLLTAERTTHAWVRKLGDRACVCR